MSKEKNLYSATRLANYLRCSHIVYSDYFEEELNLIKIETTKNQAIRMKKGDAHEDGYLSYLRTKFSKTIDIKNLDFSDETNYEKKIDLKIAKTIQSMKEGYEVIRGGWLKRDNWRGELDFLIINNTASSKLGSYSYEIIDAKNSHLSKPEHIIQLGIYAFMLESVQGFIPSKLTVALKDNILDEINTNEIYDLFLNYKNKYEDFIENKIKESVPEKKSFCNVCRWANECEKTWIKNDDLNQIHGVNKLQKSKLIDIGIKNANDLSNLVYVCCSIHWNSRTWIYLSII